MRVCFVNEAFTRAARLRLRRPGGALTRRLLVGPDTDLDTLRRIEAGLRCDEVVTAELVLADRDGAPTRVEATYRRARHRRRGELVPGAPSVTVADRAARPPALRHSEVWAEALVQGSSDLVMVADADGHRPLRQPGAARGARLRPRRVRGPPVRRAPPPRRRRPHPRRVRPPPGQRGVDAATSSGSPTRTGRGGWSACGSPTAATTRPCRGYVVNLRDVSARRRAEDLLGEQADLLEAIAKGAPLEITLDKIVRHARAPARRRPRGHRPARRRRRDPGACRARPRCPSWWRCSTTTRRQRTGPDACAAGWASSSSTTWSSDDRDWARRPSCSPTPGFAQARDAVAAAPPGRASCWGR